MFLIPNMRHDEWCCWCVPLSLPGSTSEVVGLRSNPCHAAAQASCADTTTQRYLSLTRAVLRALFTASTQLLFDGFVVVSISFEPNLVIALRFWTKFRSRGV
jgi:hypothetical protein